MKLPAKQHLLQMIKEGGEVQNLAIRKLWSSTENKCRKIVQKGRGSKEDQEDTRQEATMLLYLAISQNKFRGNTDAELVSFYKQTFLFVWLNKVRKRDQLPLSDLQEYASSIDKSIEESLIQLELQTKSRRKLKECLDKMDQKGLEIIKWRYFEIPPISWEEIAKRLGYKTTQAAQNKGGKGMKSLRICMEA